MIVLQQSVSDQTFLFIPRVYEATSMVISDEGENTTATIAITPTVSTYYLSVTATVTLVEGRSYTLEVLNGTDVVYRDKIFCTNQDIDTYSINNGEYVSNSTDDDFVIIT
jgi:hypothetical protein